MAEKLVFHIGPLGDPEVFRGTLTDGTGIELVGLDYDQPADEIDAVLARAVGYQVQTSGTQVAADRGYGGQAPFLARCPDLLVLSTPGSGIDAVSVDDCTQAGVLVVNQAGANADAVAEHVLGMMLALSKRIIQSHNALRRPRDGRTLQLAGNQLVGKTVGIVGLGHIGRGVARLCRTALEMRVLTCHPRWSAVEAAAYGAELVDFEALLAVSDFVVCTAPANAETSGLFGAKAFRRMKPSAFYINVSRPALNDEEALAAALAKGEIAGAGLDVWQDEPPSADHPLLALDSVVATAHNAALTPEALASMARAAATQLIAVLRGKRPPRLANPEAWPLFAKRFEAVMGHQPCEA